MNATYVPTTCPRCNVPNRQQSLFCNSCRLYLLDPTMTVERATYTRRFFGDDLFEGLLFIVTLVIGWFIWLIFTSKNGQTPAKSLMNTYAISIKTGRRIGRGDTWLREVVVKIIGIGAIGAILRFIATPLGAVGSLVGFVDAIWIFFDNNRQTLHDKILDQVVVYAPHGLPEAMQYEENPLLLQQLPPSAPVQPSAPEPGGVAQPGGVTQPGAITQSGAASQSESIQDLGRDLRELARLRDAGMITADEYERQRARIVSRM